MNMTRRAAAGLVVTLLAAGAAGCGDDDAAGDDSQGPVEGSTSELVTSDNTAATTEPADSNAEEARVAFFGFSAANGFAQATWSGIQQEAAERGAEVEFFDPNFDASVQVSQIQDAVTSGEYDAFIVQANDGQAVIPAIEEAIAAGIVVVGEFTPIGSDFTTIEPQVDGMIFVGTSPVSNGETLAQMAIDACADRNPCRVAYLEGFRSLPLDAARTEAVVSTLEAAPNVEVLPTVEGGYLADTGLAATQDLLVAHDSIDVLIGSSQAVLGAEQAIEAAGRTGAVALIGNGSPTQAVEAVRAGRWYAVFADAEAQSGGTALNLALDAVQGLDVPASFDTTDLLPTPIGTKDNLLPDFVGEWSS